MKLLLLLFALFAFAPFLKAQKPFGTHQNPHGNGGERPVYQAAQTMNNNEALFVRLSDGAILFNGIWKAYVPVEFSIVPGETKMVIFTSTGSYSDQAVFSVQLTHDGTQLLLDSGSYVPVVVLNTAWRSGCTYAANLVHQQSRMQPKGVSVYAQIIQSSVPTYSPAQVMPQQHVPVQHVNNGSRYGDVVTVTIEGGFVAFYGKRKNYQPVIFDIKRGERKEVEFRSKDKYPRKVKFWMRLSDDGNTLYLDDGQRKEIVLINRGWDHGQVYHPEERDDHGNRMEALNIQVSVRYKKVSRGYKTPIPVVHNTYPTNPVKVIVEGGYVAFYGKRKHYQPVAFDINPGESKQVEFVSTDKYPRKVSYLVELSADGNTLKLDADQRKAIILINRNWDRGEVYHPKERDDHGSRMEALDIKVTVHQKGKKKHH